MAPLEKLKEVFVLQPVLRKNLSRIFKIRLRLPKNRSEKGRGKTGKNGKTKVKVIFFTKRKIPDPPPLVKFRTVRGGPEFLWTVY
jgi:hypothetical protein